MGQFQAMGCPCEILMDTQDTSSAAHFLDIASTEAWRIEGKFSRYQSESVVQKINTSQGNPVSVDGETSHLLDFAKYCHQLSGGLFDVTSGVLRNIWTFDGKDQSPPTGALEERLSCVGWEKVTWNPPDFQIREGMEIDLGGLGKEYAVDKTLQILREKEDIGFLVNFGGDIAVGGKRKNNQPWTVGVEDVNHSRQATRIIQVVHGALATSGDSKKFLFIDGKRYGHILDPHTGWPVLDSPRSVTVAAKTCTEAGLLSTLAMLQGKKAETFLKSSGVRFWCTR